MFLFLLLIPVIFLTYVNDDFIANLYYGYCSRDSLRRLGFKNIVQRNKKDIIIIKLREKNIGFLIIISVVQNNMVNMN